MSEMTKENLFFFAFPSAAYLIFSSPFCCPTTIKMVKIGMIVQNKQ